MKLGVYVSLIDKLDKEYLDKFEVVERYGYSHYVSDEVMSEKMMDLMDLMLAAQEKGDTPESVVGKNIEDFCKNFFSDVSKFDFLKNIADTIRRWCVFALAFELLFLISDMGSPDFQLLTYKIEVSGYIIGILCGWAGQLLADLVSLVLIKIGKFSSKKYGIILICGVVAALVGGLTFIDGDVSVSGIGLLCVCASYLLLYYGGGMYFRYKRTGSIRKTENEYETTFTGLVKMEMKKTAYDRDESVVKIIAKRYRRVNKKRMRKNLPKLTTEEFFRKNQEERKWANLGLLGVFLPFCMELWAGTSLPSDMLIYFLFSVAFAYGGYRFMKMLDRIALQENRDILRACQKYGVELDEYSEMLLSGSLPEEEPEKDRLES